MFTKITSLIIEHKIIDCFNDNKWIVISIFLFILLTLEIIVSEIKMRENKELRELLNIKRRRDIEKIKENL